MAVATSTKMNGSSKAKTIMENIVGKAKTQTAMDVESQVDELRSELSALAATIADYGKSEGEKLKSQGLAAGEELLTRSKETLNSLSMQLSSLEKDLAMQVKQKPVQTIGIAIAVGFVIAALMRR